MAHVGAQVEQLVSGIRVGFVYCEKHDLLFADDLLRDHLFPRVVLLMLGQRFERKRAVEREQDGSNKTVSFRHDSGKDQEAASSLFDV